MYLSRLLLNPRSREARRDLAGRYDLHRTLTRVFPGARAGRDGPNDDRALDHGLLFRAEPEAPGGPVVLAQSLDKPDWDALPAGYARRVDGPKPFCPALERGQRLRFRLEANPTVKKKRDGKKNGARVPLVHDRVPESHPEVTAGYLDWLERKARDAGFTVEHVVDAPFQTSGGRAKRDLTLFGVRFDGVLAVTDPDVLVVAVRSGVGPAKGLGFGLLSLAPV